MTCEDTPSRITWEVQQLEPCSRVWMCKGYGRATTTAAPADIASAVLASYLAVSPPPYGETIRAIVRTDTGDQATATPEQLPGSGWETDPAVRQALPGYLRQALSDGAAH
ncbi:hypothetical protein [Streptomyces mexicanus]|uniref:hypothetical protein n=1 Tax=Streptomyces mexicanus TaxID=178566 RepID=UPI00364DEB0B